MTWAQITAIFTGDDKPYIAVGAAFFIVALFMRWKKDWWIGTRAYTMLVSGLLMLPLLWMALAALISNPNHTGFLQWLFQLASNGSADWANPFGKAVHGLCWGLASDWLAWILAIPMFFWLLHDLFPRVWNIRSGGSGPSTGSVGGKGVKAFGDRMASITAAEPHTTWVALFGPAMIALIPPLAIALGMPVGG